MWRKLASGVLFTGGTVMGLGVLAVLDQGHPAAAVAASFVLCTVAPVGLGTWLLVADRRLARQRLARQDAEDQRRLLQLAVARGGLVTVAEVVAETGMEGAHAERLLDGLCQRAVAEHRVAEDGTLVYRIRPLLGPAEKARARGLLDA
jgi:hypothetical protein